jgi:hypothetical protein
MRMGSLVVIVAILLAPTALAGGSGTRDNGRMEIPGHVANGVVVLDGGATLPEGTVVTVLVTELRIRRKPGKKKRVKLPLIHSKHPGSLNLSNERIAEILQDEDVRAYSKFFPKGKRP